jgi:hypothetical protein
LVQNLLKQLNPLQLLAPVVVVEEAEVEEAEAAVEVHLQT